MWRAQPIFISSTFEDFQAERDHLRNLVFPTLEERLRARRRHLEWVDLRVGVTPTGQSLERREQEILKVCLDEVKRCEPFILVLIGDRYGTVPNPERVKAALAEAGLSLDALDCSVTELEIEAGAFAKPGTRALFYVREPLDYGRMKGATAARYSSKHGNDRAQRDGEARLNALKQRIGERFPARVRRYRSGWDNQREAVVGLEAWGREVVEDLWRELSAEVGDGGARDPSLFEIERAALEEFVEDRARDFIGRQNELAQLVECATGQGGGPGIGVTGAPGSGKSALFGALLRRLSKEGVFVLAQAAGASPQAGSINTMLRRWILEMGAIAPDNNARDADLEAAFAQTLARTAQDRRVVVVIDALDQFESTQRARHFSWPAQHWPANARLIVTGIEGDAIKAALARPGMQHMPLAKLDTRDARRIVEGISARYHRTIEPDVIDALLSSREPSGRPAHANPLWVVLASEEINLIDADDIARSKKNYSGGGSERLRAMMVDVARGLPGNALGLYQTGFRRASDLIGASFVEAFIGVIAISRGGWRESDFRILLPKLSGQAWDELRFATLRRMFRGQMRRRGVSAQWDFAHAQMRAAALVGFDGPGRARLNRAIADHLLALPQTDPLRMSEAMVHLMAGEDWERSARLAGDLTEPPEAVEAMSQVMADAVLAGPGGEWNAALPRVTRIMDVASGEDRYRAAQRLQYDVFDRLANRSALDLARRLKLHKRVRDVFRAFGGPPGGDIRWHSHISAAEARVGQDLQAMGDLAAAEQLYQKALSAALELTRMDPDYAEWNRDCSVAYNTLGRLYLDKGDKVKATTAFKSGLEQIEIALRKQPDQTEWRRDLAISKGHLGEAADAEAITSARAREARDDINRQIDLAHDYDAKTGSLLSAGRLREAERVARDALGIYQSAARLDPKDNRNRRNLARAWRRLADILDHTGSHHEAIEATRTAVAQAKALADADPGNSEWAGDAAAIAIALARRLAEAGIATEAAAVLADAQSRLDALITRAGRRPIWLEYCAQAKTCAATIAGAGDDLVAAAHALEVAVKIRREVAALEADNNKKALGQSLAALGAMQWRRRELEAAERALSEAMQIADFCARSDQRDIDAAQLAATCVAVLGEIKGARAQHGEALKLFEAARQRLKAAANAAPEFASLRQNLARATFNSGYAHGRLGRHDQARALQREAIILMTPFAAEDERIAAQIAAWRAQLFESENLAASPGDLAAQEERCKQALAFIEQRHGALPAEPAARAELIGLYQALRTLQAQRGDLVGAQSSFQALRRLGG